MAVQYGHVYWHAAWEGVAGLAIKHDRVDLNVRRRRLCHVRLKHVLLRLLHGESEGGHRVSLAGAVASCARPDAF